MSDSAGGKGTQVTSMKKIREECGIKAREGLTTYGNSNTYKSYMLVSTYFANNL